MHKNQICHFLCKDLKVYSKENYTETPQMLITNITFYASRVEMYNSQCTLYFVYNET